MGMITKVHCRIWLVVTYSDSHLLGRALKDARWNMLQPTIAGNVMGLSLDIAMAPVWYYSLGLKRTSP